jgi:catechol 2,3-dioxygenase-like lactoylglutathione lyase family enzyme
MSTPTLGRIRAVTLVCPDLDVVVADYSACLGYREIERGAIEPALAAAWGATGVTGCRYAVLGPVSGAETYLRFIEIPGRAAYAPYSAYGWNAIELTVQDCDAAVARLAGGPFRVVGPPEDLGFSAGALRAGQLVGPLGEIIYLTQVRRPMPGFELPPAASPVDRVFIVVLHGSSAEGGLAEYAARFGNTGAGTFDVAVAFMAEYQGLDPAHAYRIGTLGLAPGFYLELDGSPPHIGVRPVPPESLPGGIAMVSFETAMPADVSSAPSPGGALYGSRTTMRVTGPFGEWLELLSAPR